MKPEKAAPTLPVILFIHGGVWIAGDWDNHKRFVRDLVVGSGAAAVFVEYTPIPDAIYPTQVEENYAAAKWVVDQGGAFGLDASRMAVAGNSVGGNMSAALTMMAKDRKGPKIVFQLLMFPATDASVDTASYHEFATGRFLTRAFMKFGWDIYAPNDKIRNLPYVSPLRASLAELRDLPPALVITIQNDPLRDEGEAYARRLKEGGQFRRRGALQRHHSRLYDLERRAGRRRNPGCVQAGQRRVEGIFVPINARSQERPAPPRRPFLDRFIRRPARGMGNAIETSVPERPERTRISPFRVSTSVATICDPPRGAGPSMPRPSSDTEQSQTDPAWASVTRTVPPFFSRKACLAALITSSVTMSARRTHWPALRTPSTI